MAPKNQIRVKRVYDDPDPADGARVLVDRLWPRGLKKESAQLDLWCKEVAPSAELRKWYGHDVDLFEEFSKRYTAELQDDTHREALDRIRGLDGVVTLLTATKDVDHSQVPVILEALED